VGDQAGPARRDLPEELGDDALREVVGLDLLVHGQPPHARGQVPVAADHALDQALVGEVVDAPRLSVPLAGGVDDREVPGTADGQEVGLDPGGQLLRVSDAHEPARGDGGAVRDEGDGVREG